MILVLGQPDAACMRKTALNRRAIVVCPSETMILRGGRADFQDASLPKLH
jgi:hypothetical protein